MDDPRETTSKRRRKTADKAANSPAVEAVLPDRALRAILGRVALPKADDGAGADGEEISAVAALPEVVEETAPVQRPRRPPKRVVKSRVREPIPSGAGLGDADLGDVGTVNGMAEHKAERSRSTTQRERPRGPSTKSKRSISRKSSKEAAESAEVTECREGADTTIDAVASPGVEGGIKDEIDHGEATQPAELTTNTPESAARPVALDQASVFAETVESGHESRSAAPPLSDDDVAIGGAAAAPSPMPPGEHGGLEPHTPSRHHWVYVALALFLAAIGFGLWGLWTTVISPDDDPNKVAELRRRNERLSQDVSTLRRSDQISREANRDLQRTLAERDEEIAGLRADIAFYERFVGATGQRRGLSVHDLEMRLQNGDVWHFVATLTQNLNRGAVNSGRLTLSMEGTRNDRLERLSWSSLRKQNNAPGLGYSFKYFQQVEGEVMLPAGFKPLRVTVRLVPAGGSTAEQSFPWPDTLH